MTKRRLKPEEQIAWARVTRSVVPMSGQAAAGLRPDTVTDADLSAPRPPAGLVGTGRKTLPPSRHAWQAPDNRGRERRVRRGQVAFSATLDLHGHTQVSAHQAVHGFLASAQMRGARCVLIITGKGRSGTGVLKQGFRLWLESPQARSLVAGYAVAHARHGGEGAFYVFLRRG